MKENYYYLVSKFDEGSRSHVLASSTDNFFEPRSQNEGSEEDFSIPYWALITIEGSRLYCKAHIPLFRSTESWNTKSIIQMIRYKIDIIIKKVNSMLLVDQLRSTLECSDLLQIGDIVVESKPGVPNVVTTVTKTHSMRSGPKKTAKKFENFSRRTDRLASTKPEEVQRQMQISISAPLIEHRYKVPMIHMELFPISERFKTETSRKNDGITLLKDSSFLRNFKISNRPNCYLAFFDKQIYILVFEETEANNYPNLSEYNNSTVDSPSIKVMSSDSKSFIAREEFTRSKEKEGRLSFKKEISNELSYSDAKTNITLKIHSLEEKNENAIKYITNQISEQLTAESVKLLAPKYLKYKHIRLSKDDNDFFSIGVPVKVPITLILYV